MMCGGIKSHLPRLDPPRARTSGVGSLCEISSRQGNCSSRQNRMSSPHLSLRVQSLLPGGPAQHSNHHEDSHTLWTLLARSNSVTSRARTQARLGPDLLSAASCREVSLPAPCPDRSHLPPNGSLRTGTGTPGCWDLGNSWPSIPTCTPTAPECPVPRQAVLFHSCPQI